MKLRALYLRAVVAQDAEQVSESRAASDLSSNITLIEDAFSEKMGTLLQAISTVVTSLIIAFLRGWRLALVLSTTTFFLIIKDLVASTFDAKIQQRVQTVQQEASTLAEECISGIRTINACSAQSRVSTRYIRILDRAVRMGVKKSFIPAFQFASTGFVVFMSYALAFWYGTILLSHGKMGDGGSILM